MQAVYESLTLPALPRPEMTQRHGVKERSGLGVQTRLSPSSAPFTLILPSIFPFRPGHTSPTSTSWSIDSFDNAMLEPSFFPIVPLISLFPSGSDLNSHVVPDSLKVAVQVLRTVLKISASLVTPFDLDIASTSHSLSSTAIFSSDFDLKTQLPLKGLLTCISLGLGDFGSFHTVSSDGQITVKPSASYTFFTLVLPSVPVDLNSADAGTAKIASEATITMVSRNSVLILVMSSLSFCVG